MSKKFPQTVKEAYDLIESVRPGWLLTLSPTDMMNGSPYEKIFLPIAGHTNRSNMASMMFLFPGLGTWYPGLGEGPLGFDQAGTFRKQWRWRLQNARQARREDRNLVVRIMDANGKEFIHRTGSIYPRGYEMPFLVYPLGADDEQ